MPFRCVTPGCKAGYRSHTPQDGVTRNMFPEAPDVRYKWIRAIHRDNKEPSSSSRICSLISPLRAGTRIFTEGPSNLWSRKGILKLERSPPFCPIVPCYVTATQPHAPRSSSSSTEARLQSENRQIQERNDMFLQEDYIQGFDGLCQKITEERLPEGITNICKPEYLLFIQVFVIENVPNINFRVHFSTTLQIQTTGWGNPVSTEEVAHLADRRGLLHYLHCSMALPS